MTIQESDNAEDANVFAVTSEEKVTGHIPTAFAKGGNVSKTKE